MYNTHISTTKYFPHNIQHIIFLLILLEHLKITKQKFLNAKLCDENTQKRKSHRPKYK
jgi:hypothetical protein